MLCVSLRSLSDELHFLYKTCQYIIKLLLLLAQISFNFSSNYMRMAICRNCVCLELNKLKCWRAVHRHPRMNIASVILSGRWLQSRTHGLKAPTMLGPLRHASFRFKDEPRCLCDADFLSCVRGLREMNLITDSYHGFRIKTPHIKPYIVSHFAHLGIFQIVVLQFYWNIVIHK